MKQTKNKTKTYSVTVAYTQIGTVQVKAKDLEHARRKVLNKVDTFGDISMHEILQYDIQLLDYASK